MNRYEIEIEKLGIDKNHIHLLCGVHAKISIVKIVQIDKRIGLC
ncbi:MAG: hypothetical protein GY817_04765 [bacterium]|nr:hypothetical protein [bacterium]